VLSHFLTVPNLFSLARIFLTPFVAYFLALDTPTGTIACIVIFVIAAVTDWLDGYTARRRGEITRLGIALDPIADKVFAGVTVILLVFYRDLPIWLAALILGRDLLIMAAAAILLRGRTITLPSNLTGKYTFTMIAILLASHVVRFEWGITVYTWATVAFIALSLAVYTRTFLLVRKGEPVPKFEDKPHWHYLRTGAVLIAAAWYLIRFYLDVLR